MHVEAGEAEVLLKSLEMRVLMKLHGARFEDGLIISALAIFVW